MSFPSVAEAGGLRASLGASPWHCQGSAMPALSCLAGFALGAGLWTGIKVFFPTLPELGSHRQPLETLLFLPTLSIFGFQPLHLFPASSPFCSRCNRHKQGGEREVLHSGEERISAAILWYLCSMDFFKLKPYYFSLNQLFNLCRSNSSTGQEHLG